MITIFQQGIEKYRFDILEWVTARFKEALQRQYGKPATPLQPDNV